MATLTAVVIIGAPGVGKSATLEALSDLLAAAGVAHGALELEQLAWGHPWLDFERTLPQLEAVITAQRTVGRQFFNVTATTETDAQLERLVASFPPGAVLVVALRARPDTVAARILRREPEHWSGREELASRARELAVSIARLRRVDVILDTDAREAVDVARVIRLQMAAMADEPAR